MRRSRLSEEQVVSVPKEQEAGAGTAAPCRRRGISEQTFYRRKQRYGGVGVGEAWRLSALVRTAAPPGQADDAGGGEGGRRPGGEGNR